MASDDTIQALIATVNNLSARQQRLESDHHNLKAAHNKLAAHALKLTNAVGSTKAQLDQQEAAFKSHLPIKTGFNANWPRAAGPNQGSNWDVVSQPLNPVTPGSTAPVPAQGLRPPRAAAANPEADFSSYDEDY